MARPPPHPGSSQEFPDPGDPQRSWLPSGRLRMLVPVRHIPRGVFGFLCALKQGVQLLYR